MIRLGVNIDHVATLRNARGGIFPCPVEAAKIALSAGASGITAHLREDRRHIKDVDIYRLKKEVALPLNFEMANTAEMLQIALDVKPNAVCIVPEKREEITTEGGLDMLTQFQALSDSTRLLQAAGIRVSLFVNPDLADIDAAAKTGADIVELHTGSYCHKAGDREYQRLHQAAMLAHKKGLEIHAGHGLDYVSTAVIKHLPYLAELNIGHFIISDSIFHGLEKTVKKMLAVMAN